MRWTGPPDAQPPSVLRNQGKFEGATGGLVTQTVRILVVAGNDGNRLRRRCDSQNMSVRGEHHVVTVTPSPSGRGPRREETLLLRLRLEQAGAQIFTLIRICWCRTPNERCAEIRDAMGCTVWDYLTGHYCCPRRDDS